MLREVKDLIEELNMINAGDRIVAGVSGGADSVALLLNLCEYKKLREFEIVVAHINHLIRDDAANDACFVRELCQRLGVEFKLFEIDVASLAKECHMSVEEAGRKARYDAMRSLNPTKIAVGHHEDDLTETVLLNLCRGSGLHGLAGMSPVQGDIIRPLLYVNRKQIENYLYEANESYQTDSTNLSVEYTRNKVRIEVLPYLNDRINNNSSKHIASISRDMIKVESLINRLTLEAFNKICLENERKREIAIDCHGLHSLDDIIQNELILMVMDRLSPGRKDIGRIHVRDILALSIKDGEKRISLPYNLEAVSRYGQLIIREEAVNKNEAPYSWEDVINPRSQDGDVSIKLDEKHTLKMRVFSIENRDEYPIAQYTKWLDYDKISGAIELRRRKKGDYLTVNDELQKKSLKDYMINEKIPKEERDKIPLLAVGSHVIWVIGYRISSAFKIDDNTKRVLEINVITNAEG